MHSNKLLLANYNQCLQRSMTFSSYILILPVVFLSSLTLLVFWLPAESTDKSNVGECRPDDKTLYQECTTGG